MANGRPSQYPYQTLSDEQKAIVREIVGGGGRIEEVNPMPPAVPDNLGRVVRYRGGGKTEVRVCVQNSMDEYEWIEIGEST